ncbi:MAG: hypothetical protein H8D45_28405 [Bacteroidetes bacterium]|nr:hypothetical protein [Bacteroidota bacterium]
MGRPKKKLEDQKLMVAFRLYKRDRDTLNAVSGKTLAEKVEKVIDFFRQHFDYKSD